MTGKERLLCAMRGERPDTVPWAPNLHQWFYVNRLLGTLPGELRGCDSPLDVLRHLGAEILTRWDGQLKGRGFPGEHARFRACRLTADWEGPRPDRPLVTAFHTWTDGTVLHRRLETPHGALTNTWRFEPETGADFEESHWWKDFDGEFDAVRAFVEDRHYDVDPRDAAAAQAAVGEEGLVLQEIPESPLKLLYWLAGPENGIFWLSDHADRLAELFAIHTRRTLAYVRDLLDRTDVRLVLSNDNLDARLFPPAYFERHLLAHYRAVADLVHARGGWLWVHSCGRTRALAPWVARAGIDCLEGLTPPPVGDFPLDQAPALIGPRFLVEGGDTCAQQELSGDDAPARIRDYLRALFRSLRGTPRFIFSSSCNTSPRTPWRNILALRDAAREAGRG
jgi:hypothetical protein